MKHTTLCVLILFFVLFDQALWIATGLTASVNTPYLMAGLLFRLGLLGIVVVYWRNRRLVYWLGRAVRGISWYALLCGGLVVAAAHYALPGQESLVPPENIIFFWNDNVIPSVRVYGYGAACVLYLLGISILLPRVR